MSLIQEMMDRETGRIIGEMTPGIRPVEPSSPEAQAARVGPECGKRMEPPE